MSSQQLSLCLQSYSTHNAEPSCAGEKYVLLRGDVSEHSIASTLAAQSPARRRQDVCFSAVRRSKEGFHFKRTGFFAGLVSL
jgi:hypothetical protein